MLHCAKYGACDPPTSSQLNRERVGSFVTAEEGGWRDVVVLGDCDKGVVRVCELCGWEAELRKMNKTNKAKKTSQSTCTCEHKRHV